MTPLPGALGGTELVAWRLHAAAFAAVWDSGEGAYRAGGRWNSKGVRATYCSIDPATAILEIAAHIGFEALDEVPHILTAATIPHIAAVHVVEPATLPDPAWLFPGPLDRAQQIFGDALLARHPFVVVPSVVSSHSWNLVFGPVAIGSYEMKSQERLILDPRLHHGPSSA